MPFLNSVKLKKKLTIEINRKYQIKTVFQAVKKWHKTKIFKVKLFKDA
jgi:hypothetical protein